MCIIYFAYAVRKWGTIFNYHFFISVICSSTPTTVLLTDIFPLTSIYASLQSHKLDLSIAVIDLICLLGEYAPAISSFISTQFLVLSLDGYLIHCLTNLLFFGIPLLYYCTNFNLSIICYLSLRYMHLFNFNINSSIISKNMHPF